MEGSINVKPKKKTCFVQQEIQEQNLTGFLTMIIFMHDFQHCLREELISMHSLETSERKYQCNIYQHYTKLDPLF